MFTLYVWRIKEYCHCFESYINGIKLDMAFFFFNMAFCNLSSFYLMLCGCFFLKSIGEGNGHPLFPILPWEIPWTGEAGRL